MIANEFPPIGGSGVQRSAKFAKYLPEFGYEPIIVTKKYCGGLYDESLLKDLPSDLKRHDLESTDWVNGKGFLGKVKRAVGTRIFIPDAEFFWYRKNRKHVLSLVDEFNITILYSTSYPYSDHLLAEYIKRKRPHVKWIADFRDEWTNNPYSTEKLWMRLRHPIERKLELGIVENCDFLITNTPFMLKNFITDTPDIAHHSTYIPNGFDHDDFADYRQSNQDNDRFHMVYSGALYGRRKPDHVLMALSELIGEGAIDRDRVSIEFIGNYHEHIMKGHADHFCLDGVMSVTGYMSHGDLLNHMGKANLLLLIESEKNFYTGKVFEYIKLNIPVLATVPIDGAAASVILDTNTGDVVNTEDVTAIKQSIHSRYVQWTQGEQRYEPDVDAIEKFSRKAQTEALAKCFKKA
ncbi:glycosyl transferase [Fusibacter sp. A1]|nr:MULTISPECIES: glycosyltransferase [unclassified Fusibacter]RXV60054.1 glycosyl transferase [Fusibacter sp. A1]